MRQGNPSLPRLIHATARISATAIVSVGRYDGTVRTEGRFQHTRSTGRTSLSPVQHAPPFGRIWESGKERRSTDRKKTARSPDHHAVRPSIRSDGRPAVQPFGRSLDRSLAHPLIQSAVKRADGQRQVKSRTKREHDDMTARVNAVNMRERICHATSATQQSLAPVS